MKDIKEETIRWRECTKNNVRQIHTSVAGKVYSGYEDDEKNGGMQTRDVKRVIKDETISREMGFKIWNLKTLSGKKIEL